MKVMQLRLDEATYTELEQRALSESKSMTAVVTAALSEHLDPHDDCAAFNGSIKMTTAAPANRAAM